MKKCCVIEHKGHPPACPLTGILTKPVGRITVESIVRPKIKAKLRPQPYYFCNSPDCDVVYVSAAGDHLITKDQLIVRVGIKEREDPIPVCYCFNFNREKIFKDIKDKGVSDIPKIITERVKSGACQCEIKNPSGNCCLGNIYQEVKHAQALRKQGLL